MNEGTEENMNGNGIKILLILIAALAVAGCGGGGGGEKGSGDGVKASAPSNVGAAGAATTTDGGANAAPANGNAVAPTPQSTVAAAARAGATPGGGARGVSNTPAAKMPEPQIGSGGNDFFLFTKARGALNADAELKAANVILDVKDGVVTLSGTVASAAHKSKAEELVRAAGPKAVRNQLRVSAAN